MFNVFTEQFETFDCTFDIYIDDNMQTQRIQAPRVMIQQQFLQLAQNAVNDNRAVKIVMRRDVPCYDKWSGKLIVQEHSIEFRNNAYVYRENSK